MSITSAILKRINPADKNLLDPEIRTKIGVLEGWVSAVGNVILFVIKIIFGIVTGSLALMADAFHTLSDVVSSTVIILGFKISQKPADAEHPFGHGRAETISTLTIALLIGVVGIEFLKSGVMRLITPQSIESNWLIISVICATIIVKEGMSRFSYQLGKLIDSDALKGDAVHHRSDVYSSLLVIIALIGSHFGFLRLDGIMAISVAGFMLYTAFEIARNAIDDLLGKPISKNTLIKINKLAQQITGVYKIHDIIVHKYGMQNFISLHVEVSDQETPEIMHRIADQVERRISHNMKARVVTHIDPVTLEGDHIARIRTILNNVMETSDINKPVQDLRVVGKSQVEAILFEVPTPIEYQNCDKLEFTFKNELQKSYPDANIIIEFKQQITVE